VQGHPLVYSPGSAPTPGTTSLLWPLILAPLYAAGLRGASLIWAAWVLAGAGLAGDANPPAAPKDVKEVEFRMSPTNLVSLPLA
jgi:hypothetical protein